VRLALSNSCFPGLATAHFLAVAAEAGAETCELRVVDGPEAPTEVIAAARASGVRVETVGALMDWALPNDPDPRPRLEMLVEVAAELNAPFVVCVAPIRSNGLPPRAEVQAYASERLSALAETASVAGVSLALEQVGRSSTRPGARSGIRSLADAVAVAERAGERVAVVLGRRPRLEPRLVVEPPARVRRREPHRVAGIHVEHGLEIAREVPMQRAALERQLVNHSSERTARATRSGDGMYASSIVQYGYGTS
jgi:hypothetical protein